MLTDNDLSDIKHLLESDAEREAMLKSREISSRFVELAMRLFQSDLSPQDLLNLTSEYQEGTVGQSFEKRALGRGLMIMFADRGFHHHAFPYLSKHFLWFNSVESAWSRKDFLSCVGAANPARGPEGSLRAERELNKWMGCKTSTKAVLMAAVLNDDPEAVMHLLSMKNVKRHYNLQTAYEMAKAYSKQHPDEPLVEITKKLFAKKSNKLVFNDVQEYLNSAATYTPQQFREAIGEDTSVQAKHALLKMALLSEIKDQNNSANLILSLIEDGLDPYPGAVYALEGEASYYDALDNDLPDKVKHQYIIDNVLQQTLYTKTIPFRFCSLLAHVPMKLIDKQPKKHISHLYKCLYIVTRDEKLLDKTDGNFRGVALDDALGL